MEQEEILQYKKTYVSYYGETENYKVYVSRDYANDQGYIVHINDKKSNQVCYLELNPDLSISHKGLSRNIEPPADLESTINEIIEALA